MKFKEGDRVKIVAANIFDKKEYIGNIVTITDVAGTCICPYAVFENDYWWRDNELELANEEFTKSDLKDGMVVECRNGNRGMVLGDKIIGTYGYMEINRFCDTLEYIEDNTFTIDKVYKSDAYSLDTYFNDCRLELIWERNPAKKMTIAEIEKELGYKVEIVDNKEK